MQPAIDKLIDEATVAIERDNKCLKRPAPAPIERWFLETWDKDSRTDFLNHPAVHVG